MSHEPLIEAVANTAHHMVKSKHYASQNIQENLDDLQNQLQELKDLAAERRMKLLDAVESQMVSTTCFVLGSASPHVNIVLMVLWPIVITIPLIYLSSSFCRILNLENQTRTKKMRSTFVNIFLLCKVFSGWNVRLLLLLEQSKFIYCIFTKVCVKCLFIVRFSEF